MFLNEHGEWKVIYMKLTNGKLINNSSACENVAFCYNYSFLWNYCVTKEAYNHVDLHILHTVTAWQATESTKTHVKILLSKTHVVSRDFINI